MFYSDQACLQVKVKKSSMNRASGLEIIDVHSHIYPGCYLETLERRAVFPRIIRRGDERLFDIFPPEIGGGTGRPMTAAFWDLDEKLAFMDRSGIDRSVVSLGNPWLNHMPSVDGDVLARQVNVEFSTYREKTADRVVAMGALPAGSVDAAVGELAFIAAAAGLAGVSAGLTIAGLHMDDPRLDDFWTELTRHDLPLFIHPENGIGSADMRGYGLALPLGMAFPFETTAAAARLVFGGVMERFPGLRIILAHGGGALPYLAGRLDAVRRADPALRASIPRPPSEYVKLFHFDALVYAPPALRALDDLAGSHKLMFGSDHPFELADPGVNLRAIESVFPGAAFRERVMGANARDFFKIQE